MYLFIAIIFIAELIIACTLINFIVKIDRKVLLYNFYVEAFNPLLETSLQYSRCLISSFKKSFQQFLYLLKKKRQEIIFKSIAVASLYCVLFLFKIKVNKSSKMYKLVSSIKDIAIELTV